MIQLPGQNEYSIDFQVALDLVPVPDNLCKTNASTAATSVLACLWYKTDENANNRSFEYFVLDSSWLVEWSATKTLLIPLQLLICFSTYSYSYSTYSCNSQFHVNNDVCGLDTPCPFQYHQDIIMAWYYKDSVNRRLSRAAYLSLWLTIHQTCSRVVFEIQCTAHPMIEN